MNPVLVGIKKPAEWRGSLNWERKMSPENAHLLIIFH
jgi:hypothetical protein